MPPPDSLSARCPKPSPGPCFWTYRQPPKTHTFAGRSWSAVPTGSGKTTPANAGVPKAPQRHDQMRQTGLGTGGGSKNLAHCAGGRRQFGRRFQSALPYARRLDGAIPQDRGVACRAVGVPHATVSRPCQAGAAHWRRHRQIGGCRQGRYLSLTTSPNFLPAAGSATPIGPSRCTAPISDLVDPRFAFHRIDLHQIILHMLASSVAP